MKAIEKREPDPAPGGNSLLGKLLLAAAVMFVAHAAIGPRVPPKGSGRKKMKKARARSRAKAATAGEQRIRVDDRTTLIIPTKK